jgi:hypothetical protein
MPPMRTVHVKMRTEEISAINLLAEKDRRHPAELMRFAVEEYCERRASEVVALKRKKVGDMAKRTAERSLLSYGGEISEQQKRVGEVLSKMREEKETQPQVVPQPTLAELMQRIAVLEQRARDSK